MATWQHHADFIRARNACEEVMIVSAVDGAHYASAPPTFQLRSYIAPVMTESGEEVDENINEAKSIVNLVNNASGSSGNVPVPHGLRLNSGKKQMIIRTFLDEESKLPVIYGKFPKGGTCIASAGKVILIGSFYETKDQVGATCNDTIQIMARYLNDSVWPAVDAADSGGAPAVSESQAKLTWQPFCDQMLVGKGHIAECLIADKGSGSMYAWSTCPQLRQKAEAAGGKASFGLLKYEAELPQEDGTDKLTAIDEGAAVASLMSKTPGFRPPGGLRFNKVKYQFIRGGLDEISQCNTAHAKKIKGGAVVSVTEKVIIVATFDENFAHTGAGCATAVADLAKYLGSCGH